jgi:hypothetical protein
MSRRQIALTGLQLGFLNPEIDSVVYFEGIDEQFTLDVFHGTQTARHTFKKPRSETVDRIVTAIWLFALWGISAGLVQPT